ncbi:MAG TPA: nuclear transport factor 2 family protein [Ktedonobacteraceae bacterium]|nr:nuclear transport factor 2 family protein [Ktedonobacteraceae bacterium]
MQIHENENQVSLHRALVSQWIEAFNGHNVLAILSLYADNAELYDSGMKHPRRGRAEIEQWFTTRFQTMPSITYIPASQLYTEAQAAVTWTVRGRSPRLLGQSWLSRPFQVDGVSIFTLQNGRIQKQRGYYDHLSTLEQILPPLKWILPRRL